MPTKDGSTQNTEDPGRLGRLFELPARRPWLTLALAALVLLLAAAGMTRLRVSADLRSMLAKGDPSAEAMAHVFEEYALVDEMFVLVTLPGTGEPTERELSAMKAYAARFEEKARADIDLGAMAAGVTWRSSPEYRRFVQDLLVPAGLLYLSDAEFAEVRRRLTPESMASMIASSEALLEAPGPAQGFSQLAARDPLRLHEFMIGRLERQRRAMPTYHNDDAFIAPDGRMLLIRVTGKKGASDLEFAKAFTGAVGAVAQEADPSADGVPLGVELSGAYAIAAESERSIRRDLIVNCVSSSVAIALLFLVAYRSAWSWPWAMAPLVWGILVSFGAYSLVSQRVTPLTAAIGAVLAGLGVDYCIHYLSNFMSRMGTAGGATSSIAGNPTALSLTRVAGLTARASSGPLAAACATSVLGFLAIGASHVQAVREFAVLAAMGLVFVLLGVFTVLPALLALTARGHGTRESMRLRLSPDGLVGSVSKHATAWVAVMGVLVCAAAALVLAKPGGPFTFEPDLSVMHPRPNPPLEAQHRMADRFGVEMGGLLLLMKVEEGPDSGVRLLALSHEVERRLSREAVTRAGVGGVFGLSSLLPDPAATPARIRAMRAIDADRVARELTQAIERSEYLEPAAYEGYVKLVRLLLTPPGTVGGAAQAPTVESLRDYPSLAAPLLPRGAFESGRELNESVAMVWTNRLITSREDREAVVDAIRGELAGLPGVTLTGLSVIGHDTEQVVRRDLWAQMLIAMALVAIYLLAWFRSVADTLLALIPPAGTLVLLLAAMDLCGQRFNMVNLITLPMLVGIGVDYGIFMVCVARERAAAGEEAGDLTRRMAVACHALTMTTATTMLGLGTLAFTSVPAVASLGWASSCAMAACLALTVLLLMPLLILRAKGSVRSAPEKS